MQASLPIRSKPTLSVWGQGGVPQRTQWGLGASVNLTIRIICLGHGYTWQNCPQTFIPTGGPPLGHTRRPYAQDPIPCGTSTPTSPSHLAMECPPKTDSHISMTAEVQELLLHVMLDTFSQALGDSTPKRPTSVALSAPPSTRAEDSPKHVDTPLHASLQWLHLTTMC